MFLKPLDYSSKKPYSCIQEANKWPDTKTPGATMSEANFSHSIKVSCEILEEYTQNGFTSQLLKGQHVHSVVVRDSNDDVVSWETFSGPLAFYKAKREYYQTLTYTAHAHL